MSLVCVNTSKKIDLINIVGKINADIIENYIKKYGNITKKEIVKNIIGTKNYNSLKQQIYITPPTKLLSINNSQSFLHELSNFNDELVNSKISTKISEIQSSSKSYGYIYILRRDEDKYTRWYKVGMTKREPEIRADEWGYNLVFFAITSNHKKFERLIHLYLNFAHCNRKAMHGKGKNEVEWFYIALDIIKTVIISTIECYDSEYENFKKNNITRISDI
jgi:hypothetical protein